MTTSTNRAARRKNATAAQRKRPAAKNAGRPAATAPAIPAAPPHVATPSGKLGVIVGLLGRPEGATLADLTAATGWQGHSVRGAIAGAIKKKLGLKVTSQPRSVGRTYRLSGGAER